VIYTPKSTILIGKPVRVFVNGNEVDQAVYADDVKGLVVFCPQPTRCKKNSDKLYTRKLRGKVTVELIKKEQP